MLGGDEFDMGEGASGSFTDDIGEPEMGMNDVRLILADGAPDSSDKKRGIKTKDNLIQECSSLALPAKQRDDFYLGFVLLGQIAGDINGKLRLGGVDDKKDTHGLLCFS